MGLIRNVLRSPATITSETHRATSFEIFFDLVFIFALTRIISFMAGPPTATSMTRGLVLLLLLWMAWTTYTWLGNQTRADVGLVAVGLTMSMAAFYVVALVIPDAWLDGGETLDAPLALAVAYIVLRMLDLVLYFYATTGNRRMHTTLRLFATTTVLAWVPLLIGAVIHGTAQTLLWIAAFLIDFGGASSRPGSAAGTCAAPATSPNGTPWCSSSRSGNPSSRPAPVPPGRSPAARC